MRSRDSCIQKLNELNYLQKQHVWHGSEQSIVSKLTLRAQMKGILYAMSHIDYDEFSISGDMEFTGE